MKCRIVVTDECNRNCEFCCMKDKETYDSFSKLNMNLLHLLGYPEYMLTGGEPLMDMRKLLTTVAILKQACPNSKVYVYTNGDLLSEENAKIMKVMGVDGINWGPKEKPDLETKLRMNYIHHMLIPVRILIQDELYTTDTMYWAKGNEMRLKIWTDGDCYDMELETRYRLVD